MKPEVVKPRELRGIRRASPQWGGVVILRLPLLLLTALLTGISCQTAEPPPSIDKPISRVELSDGWLAMGTFFEVELRVAPSQRAQARDWIRAARVEIARLEGIYSRHDPSSELSRLNLWLSSKAGDNSPASLGPELSQILNEAREVSLATHGAFDVGVGGLVETWAEADDSTGRPTRQAIEDVLMRLAVLRSQADKAQAEDVSSPDRKFESAAPVSFDLDGLSKGAVLDRLRLSFVSRFPGGAALLSFGESSIVAIGAPDEEGWRLVLQSSGPERGRIGDILLRDQALSMSSSRGHVYEINGQVYSHVINPGTGEPIGGLVEAIVIAESALLADAWSTALVVRKQIPEADAPGVPKGFEALLIEADGQKSQTSGW